MSFSGKTPEQLLEKAQEYDEKDLYGKRVQAFNSVLQVAFDEAYRTGDDADVIEFAEEVFAPDIQAFYSEVTGNTVDYEKWFNKFSGIDSEAGIFHIPATDSAPYDYLRSCMETVEEDYDHLVGIHSGGLAPLYAVEDLFEAEPVVLRYSHRDREDENVQITPGMEQRADFDGSEILVLDDVIESGETFREVGQHLKDQGAEGINAVPVRTSMWNMSHDTEMLDLLKGGVKNTVIEYEKRKDCTEKRFES